MPSAVYCEPHSAAVEVDPSDAAARGEPGHALRVPAGAVGPPGLVGAGAVWKVAPQSVDLGDREFDDGRRRRAECPVQGLVSARDRRGARKGRHVGHHFRLSVGTVTRATEHRNAGGRAGATRPSPSHHRLGRGTVRGRPRRRPTRGSAAPTSGDPTGTAGGRSHATETGDGRRRQRSRRFGRRPQGLKLLLM